MSKLITTRQAATIIGCTTNHVLTLIKKGKLKAIKQWTDTNQYGYRYGVRLVDAEAYAKLPQRGGYPRGQKRN